jgi:hypothetical protein
LSLKTTENVKGVDVSPDPGLAVPLFRAVVCPPPVEHWAATTVAANGALKPSTIVAINDGTSRPNTGRVAG